jgi:hypothetical protein
MPTISVFFMYGIAPPAQQSAARATTLQAV